MLLLSLSAFSNLSLRSDSRPPSLSQVLVDFQDVNTHTGNTSHPLPHHSSRPSKFFHLSPRLKRLNGNRPLTEPSPSSRHHAGLQVDKQIFRQPRLLRERQPRHSATPLHLVPLLPKPCFRNSSSSTSRHYFSAECAHSSFTWDGDPAGIVGSEFLSSAL